MKIDKKILEKDWERLFKKYENSDYLPPESIKVGDISVGFVNGLRVIGYRNVEDGSIKDLKWNGGGWEAEEKEYCSLSWYGAGINETDMMILTKYYNVLEQIKLK